MLIARGEREVAELSGNLEPGTVVLGITLRIDIHAQQTIVRTGRDPREEHRHWNARRTGSSTTGRGARSDEVFGPCAAGRSFTSQQGRGAHARAVLR